MCLIVLKLTLAGVVRVKNVGVEPCEVTEEGNIYLLQDFDFCVDEDILCLGYWYGLGVVWE